MAQSIPLGSSFRDPAGFLFRHDGVLYRQINQAYAPHYERLMSSGLYAELTGQQLLVSHAEADCLPPPAEDCYRVIRPETIPFVSYPYEWCFGQLQDAALTTLAIQRVALRHGMTLKDASAYNIQFLRGRPVLIDTLSFEIYEPGEPWIAYRQFCQHFLAPLALSAYRDVRLSRLLRFYILGLPLDLTSSLLPWHTRLNLGLQVHVHLHSRSQEHYATQTRTRHTGFTQASFQGLLDSLEATIRRLRPTGPRGAWTSYYLDTSYSDAAFAQKHEAVAAFLERLGARQVWDLGGNTGRFSRLASDRGIHTVSFDFDPWSVEHSYRQSRDGQDPHLLPLVIDLVNPSPALGWAHLERRSLMDRGPVQVAMALALVHHLVIGNSIPLQRLAVFFRAICEAAIIEFVPPDDAQAQRLMRNRSDDTHEYTQDAFEAAFSEYFEVVEAVPLQESCRTLYLLKAREADA